MPHTGNLHHAHSCGSRRETVNVLRCPAIHHETPKDCYTPNYVPELFCLQQHTRVCWPDWSSEASIFHWTFHQLLSKLTGAYKSVWCP